MPDFMHTSPRYFPITVNIPNSITIFRLILTAIFIVAISIQRPWSDLVALVSFSVAAASDWFDGYYARKLNLVTSLGKLLDPLADKVLVAAGFVYLSSVGYCPIWVTCLLIGREFMVTGLRQIAIEQGVVIAADKLGKWKTSFQLLFIITSLTHISFTDPHNKFTEFFHFLSQPSGYLLPISLWAAVALTVISGWNYLWNGRHLLKG